MTSLTSRQFYWSIRRELWENRYLFLAPLAVAAAILAGYLINAFTSRVSMLVVGSVGIGSPYAMAGGLLICTGCMIGAYYCVDALYGERRDRAILFWKSLPVSDRLTVLSKASIPLIVLPAIVFVIMIATHLALLALEAASGGFARLHVLLLVKVWIAVLYGLAAIALWHAPIFGWLLLVSAWARRSVLLWVLLPPIAIGILERIVFNTAHFAQFLQYRCLGWFTEAFNQRGPCCVPDPLKILTPARFFASPGLWFGLAAAVIFLAGAARLRRSR